MGPAWFPLRLRKERKGSVFMSSLWFTTNLSCFCSKTYFGEGNFCNGCQQKCLIGPFAKPKHISTQLLGKCTSTKYIRQTALLPCFALLLSQKVFFQVFKSRKCCPFLFIQLQFVNRLLRASAILSLARHRSLPACSHAVSTVFMGHVPTALLLIRRPSRRR